jgi:hypothetical protein
VTAAPAQDKPSHMPDWDPANLDATIAAVATGFDAQEPTAVASKREDVIVVEGLDEKVWSSSSVEPVDGESRDPASPPPVFSAEPLPTMGPQAVAPSKQYKILMQNDPYFEGAFNFDRLEEVLNHQARQGWVVRSMVSASEGGDSAPQIVVLLER